MKFKAGDTPFSHLYIEKAVLEHSTSQRLMARFHASRIITVHHYKDIFNRNGQNFYAQKRAPNLILAEARTPFFYEGSVYSDDFEYEAFWYVPSVLGCLYDCDYCYLQGMLKTGNSTLFVNIEAMIEAVLAALKTKTLVAISYDTDLLAIESLTGHVAAWIAALERSPLLDIEVRTKSANIKPLLVANAHKQLLVSISISVQPVIDAYERGTTSLAKRIASAKQLLDAGFRVRLCIDPIIEIASFETHYAQMIEALFSRIDAHQLEGVSIGMFRMSATYANYMKKEARSDLMLYPFDVREKVARYSDGLERKRLAFVKQELLRHISEQKIRVWQA